MVAVINPPKKENTGGPADEKQFKSMRAAHLTYLILYPQQKNPLFRSPYPDTAKHILDIGAGNGTWAVETADKYPSATFHAVNLSPPTDTWAPPNCVFEVDDVLEEWTFKDDMDFAHIRSFMLLLPRRVEACLCPSVQVSQSCDKP